MADLKISQLNSLTVPATSDELVILDVSDTTMGISGSNKRITRANFLLISGNPVGDSDTQTLTNKTITSPTISNPTVSTGTFTSPVFSTSADLNGAELILDSDADTSVTADTDDQIDIKIAGADDFRFTANTFTALSGSSIATNTISETTGGSGVTIDSLLIKDGAPDLNGVEMILDADGDTSIVADTDDQIDINVGGNTDRFRFGGATFSVRVAGGTIVTDIISEFTTAGGVTIDSLLIKDGGARLTNNTTLKSRNNAGSADLDLIKANSSDQTALGQNAVRPTRYVPIDPNQILSTDPINTNWTDLDLTSITSARTIAVTGTLTLVSSAASGTVYFRKNGSSDGQGNLTGKIRNAVGGVIVIQDFIQQVDTDQIFEWSVNNDSNVSNVTIVITGYMEYVD